MAHQLGVVFVEERIAVVGEVDDEGVLLAVALYDLVDLLGIHTEYTQPRFNFFAPTYDDRRTRIVVSPTSNKKMVME